MLQQLQKLFKKDQLCSYGCGQIANYIVASGNKPCCSQCAYDCKNYSKWCGDRKRQRYKDSPEMIETQKRIGKEVHNRKSVIKKKRKAMIDLHKNDPEFVKNYNKGRDIYRNLVEKLSKDGEHWSGPGESYSHYHTKARELYYKSYCERCGCTFQLHMHLYGIDLHIHCVDKNYKNLSEDNWSMLCVLCHGHERKKDKNKKED